MAGDWIKMRIDLSDDPAVVLMAASLDITEDEVVGKLHRLWGWADRHTVNGAAPGITAKWVDRYISSGFAAAMQRVGWLQFSDDSVFFPNFDRHNGASAKQRGEAAIRQRLSRENRDKVVTEVTLPSRKLREDAVTREEERREEKIKKEEECAGAPSSSNSASQLSESEDDGFAHIPTIAEVVIEGARTMIPEEYCERFHANATEGHHWLSHGRLVGWKSRLRRFWSKDIATWKPRNGGGSRPERITAADRIVNPEAQGWSLQTLRQEMAEREAQEAGL